MSKGPWLENAMWTPDEDTTPNPVVRQHYFVVCAEVREDGTYELRLAHEMDHFDSDEPVYLPAREEWTRLSDFEDEDATYQNDLMRRLR